MQSEGAVQGSAPTPEVPFARRAVEWARHELHEPSAVAVLVGATLFAAAASVGIGEAVLGAAGAYVAYRVVRRREKKAHRRAAAAEA